MCSKKSRFERVEPCRSRSLGGGGASVSSCGASVSSYKSGRAFFTNRAHQSLHFGFFSSFGVGTTFGRHRLVVELVLEVRVVHEVLEVAPVESASSKS